VKVFVFRYRCRSRYDRSMWTPGTMTVVATTAANAEAFVIRQLGEKRVRDISHTVTQADAAEVVWPPRLERQRGHVG